MRAVRIAAAAEEDLKEIWAYLAEHDAATANKIVKEIINRFTRLRDFPNMGREQEQLMVNLRSFTIKNYVIFNQPFDNGIEILRVLHTSCDIENVFESFFDSL